MVRQGVEAFTYAMDPPHAVWHSPYPIPLNRERTVQVYGKTANVGIKVVRPPLDMRLIGREPADQTHYNLLQQSHALRAVGLPGRPARDDQ